MIAIVDYGMGNLGSIANTLRKVGAPNVISSDPEVMERADRLILPGVGAFDTGVKNLTDRKLLPLLNRQVLKEKKPVLGVCLGMQLLARRSEEGQLPGLAWLDAEIIRFKFDEDNIDFKNEVCIRGGREETGLDPVQHALNMERQGAGELLLNSIDRDGTMQGYDLELIREVTDVVGIPVVACGGARTVQDLVEAVHQGRNPYLFIIEAYG
jgi:hypothetical protein